MAKVFVPSTTWTPSARVREVLDNAERRVSNLRGGGPQVLELLHLFDQAAGGLAELEADGANVRAERVRFETLQRQLRSRQVRFLAQGGAALQEERAAVQPERARWWWYLDEEVARQRARRLRRWLISILAGVIVLAVAWLVYDRFIAPPPHVRQALQHISSGEFLVDEQDLRGALAEYEAATVLSPDNPRAWTWQGVIHSQLGELDDAEMAFEAARSLYETDFDFLLNRGMMFLHVGDLVAADADVEQAIRARPDSGYGYFLRAGIAAEQEEYAAAVADLERAAELAHIAEDTQLEATARAQLAMVMQMQVYQQAAPTP
jgi:tetratricopeptide (TPR) repeat protein